MAVRPRNSEISTQLTDLCSSLTCTTAMAYPMFMRTSSSASGAISAQRQSRHHEQQDREDGDELVWARLDEYEGAGKAGQPEQHASQRLGGQARPGKLTGLGRGNGQHQKAFSVLASASGVFAGIKRANSTDQFSM